MEREDEDTETHRRMAREGTGRREAAQEEPAPPTL